MLVSIDGLLHVIVTGSQAAGLLLAFSCMLARSTSCDCLGAVPQAKSRGGKGTFAGSFLVTSLERDGNARSHAFSL